MGVDPMCYVICANKQVLRDQGLGKYCDPEFVRAASREMQEAMEMTEEEFDQAAHRLLQAEQAGQIRLPLPTSTSEGGAAATQGGRWGDAGAPAADEDEEYLGDEDDETIPLRQPPARFTARSSQPGDRGAAPAPTTNAADASPTTPSAVVVPPTPSPTSSTGAGGGANQASLSSARRPPRGRSRATPERGSAGDRGGVPEHLRGKDFRRDPIL